MVMTRYALEDFVGDMQELVATRPSQDQLFDRGSVYLERLIRNPDALPEEFQRPSGTGKRANHGSYALHRSEGLFVSAVVWGPGDRIGPHDHKTWGMIGVMGNAIEETRFRRVYEHDEYVKLEKDRSVLVKPGDVSLLIPEIDEIHAMNNPSDRPTFEIHVYGADLVGLPRTSYNLDTGRVTHFKSTKFDNC